jgi:hypothetical protein
MASAEAAVVPPIVIHNPKEPVSGGEHCWAVCHCCAVRGTVL